MKFNFFLESPSLLLFLERLKHIDSNLRNKQKEDMAKQVKAVTNTSENRGLIKTRGLEIKTNPTETTT